MPSLGEYRVGLSFNPSGDEKVEKIKRWSADMIDQLAGWQAETRDGEIRRLFALAMTDIETAAMHAVKAVTKKRFTSA